MTSVYSAPLVKAASRALQLVLFIIASTEVTHAQHSTSYRVGFVSAASSVSMATRLDAFSRGLRELGYIDGQHISIFLRWGEGSDERLPSLTSELVLLKMDVIVSHGVLATIAARAASTTIPIVCFPCGDVVGTGVVNSLARPGSANITGLTIIAPDVTGKRLELLQEIVPSLRRVAILYNIGNPVSEPELRETEAAARSLGVEFESVGVKDPAEIENAFAFITRNHADAVMVLSDAMSVLSRADDVIE